MSGSPCCPPGSWGNPQADGGYQHRGEFVVKAGVNCYVTGASAAKVVILSFSDVFPCLMDRKREVCDQLAEAIPDSLVVAPDYFNGKPIIDPPNPKAGKFQTIAGMVLSTPRIFYRMRFFAQLVLARANARGTREVATCRSPSCAFSLLWLLFWRLRRVQGLQLSGLLRWAVLPSFSTDLQDAAIRSPADFARSAVIWASPLGCPTILLHRFARCSHQITGRLCKSLPQLSAAPCSCCPQGTIPTL